MHLIIIYKTYFNQIKHCTSQLHTFHNFESPLTHIYIKTLGLHTKHFDHESFLILKFVISTICYKIDFDLQIKK